MLLMHNTSVRRYDSCSIMSPFPTLQRAPPPTRNSYLSCVLMNSTRLCLAVGCYCFAHTFVRRRTLFTHAGDKNKKRNVKFIDSIRENKQKREEKLPFATSLKIISFQLCFKPIECLLSYFFPPSPLPLPDASEWSEILTFCHKQFRNKFAFDYFMELEFMKIKIRDQGTSVPGGGGGRATREEMKKFPT